MTASLPATAADLLMVGPLLPELVADLESRYRVHRLWEAQDPAALLREHGAAIRGIATSGRFGADKELINALPALEGIFSFGVGYDTIDVAAAKARNVVVTNTPGVLDACVADTALALMLAVSRRIAEADRFVRAGRWPGEGFGLGTRMSGKRCGIVGLGNIGLQIARRAQAFDMDILYTNRKPRPDAPADYRYCPDIVDLARQCDYLVLAVPGGSATRHMVNAQVLDALGPDGWLINIARGTVVDETALVAALQHKRIAGAGLDVFEHEPATPPELNDMENVVMLPHIASGTHETRRAMADLVRENLDGWFSQGQVRTRVV
ncbi:2-hydroxyacid dehydrogenase [Achromobacter arsenitoxydans]|uniref:Glyoxylate reductase n=1 Tax=Achromobacter arsenitoxydans SY8 TaxID=477184 RepID=H0F139_9BURK|nr:2-hydroxyacid dehydrogenase [Achromobacter arsenitoxydans]EHK68077.1 glyoxylate reductase [Achromobacter arsenitoxydans SY8]